MNVDFLKSTFKITYPFKNKKDYTDLDEGAHKKMVLFKLDLVVWDSKAWGKIF